MRCSARRAKACPARWQSSSNALADAGDKRGLARRIIDRLERLEQGKPAEPADEREGDVAAAAPASTRLPGPPEQLTARRVHRHLANGNVSQTADADEQAPPLRWSREVHAAVAAKHPEEAEPPELHSDVPCSSGYARPTRRRAAQAQEGQGGRAQRPHMRARAQGSQLQPLRHVSPAAARQRHAARRIAAGAAVARQPLDRLREARRRRPAHRDRRDARAHRQPVRQEGLPRAHGAARPAAARRRRARQR
jgi:hypothetical protein